MSTSEPNNTNNPMKKRFRSWQPSPDEQPRRHRRYPRLVVRDRTGNHIANDIATAPKVELPKKPVLPLSVNVPTASSPNADGQMEEIVPNQDTPSKEAAPIPVNSPMYSASSEDRGAQNIEKQLAHHSPTSPLLPKSTAVNNPGDTCIANYPASRDAGMHPRQSVTTPAQGTCVNSVPAHAQTVYPQPQYNPGPKPTTAIYSPHDVSSCTPTPSVEPIRPATAARDVPYSAQVVRQSAPYQSGQYENHGGYSSPRRSAAFPSQARGYLVQQGEPATAASAASAPTPAPLEPYPHGNSPQSEKVILAGKRCGTVEYWRSSLQMPREKGVVKSVKPSSALQIKRRVKQGTPERTLVAEPIRPPPPPPTIHATSVPVHTPPGYAAGYPSITFTAEYNPQRPVQTADYGGPSHHEQSPRPLDQSPRRPETGIEHEFWRTATKLPRASAEASRVKKLANGRRRVDGANVGYAENPREAGVTSSMNDPMVAGSPVSGRQYAGAPQASHMNGGMQSEYAPQASSSVQGVQYSSVPYSRAPISSAQNVDVNRQQIVMRPGSAPTDKMNNAKAESETRRLLFLRDFELRRLRTLAQSKFHVKMNLRGRMKLEQWVCSDSVTVAASTFIVSMFNLDRRVLSKNDDIRRNSLYDMTNEDLRILEALMSRVRSRGGRTNWALLTSSLSLESFITTLPTTEAV